jgi:hypothetical protein
LEFKVIYGGRSRTVDRQRCQVIRVQASTARSPTVGHLSQLKIASEFEWLETPLGETGRSRSPSVVTILLFVTGCFSCADRVEVKSAIGVDYSKLEALLAAENWKDADRD